MSPQPTAPMPSITGLRVVFLSWRDTLNPEGGGAERYLEEMAEGLAAEGADVTVLCAAYAAAPPVSHRNGVRYVHRGGKMTVYPQGMRALRRGDLGRADVVVDVQNGLPFFSPLVTRTPIVVLVHHVHREQWPVVYPGTTGRVGWWIERRLAPWLYRHQQYVAVSRATREELALLGVRRDRVAVVHNGTEQTVPSGAPKSAYPSICVVGRLVPHKQVEHAIDATVALRAHHPDLRLTVVGGGWWTEELHDYAERAGATGFVEFTGHVDEDTKRAVYERSWVMALPSLKEGWGLVVGEAAMAGTPTVAYASAGGTRESIVDGHSGLLVDDEPAFGAALGRVLDDDDLRERLALGAREVSARFTWGHAHAAFAHVLLAAVRREVVAAADELEPNA